MTMWGGRFEEDPSDVLWSYTADEADRRLLVEDVEGSIAHAGMLAHVGILAPEEHRVIHEGLLGILDEARTGAFEFAPGDEDVHTAVERRLVELAGDVGGKLHTGRSRNDQVALDLRLYLRRSAMARGEQLRRFGLTLVGMAERYRDVVVPSYTHLQQAQAVPLGHHLLAYAWMARRDLSRFLAVRERLGVSPLGAGASGGSSLPLDPVDTAKRLGLDTVFANSMDAVGSRDLVAEYVWCCAQTMVHASRLSEELILWATEEFGWVRLSDAHTTGSSALPQKKNPDIAELARGRAAGTIGDLTALLALQKGLPLAYNRDLQEDKIHAFRADDTVSATLDALTEMIAGAEFDPPSPRSWVTALDLAEALVSRGVPFREAHHLVGRLVGRLESSGRDLAQATTDDLTAVDRRFEASDLELTDPLRSVDRRVTPGGGSPASVSEQSEALRLSFARE